MKYFGTDGIRGVPNFKLTVDLITSLGRALVILNLKNVIIGTDTRQSKDMIASAMIAGCLASGLDVSYVEIIPTPGLIYLSKIYDSIGVMITASHNPYRDNGIKIVKKGRKLNQQEEAQIEAFIEQPAGYYGAIGRMTTAKYMIKEYHRHLCESIVPTDLKIAIDCANGATYKTAPLLFSLITNALVVIGNQPDGCNINLHCGSTNLDKLKSTVLEQHCDLGIAFDGDGDRILCLDQYGNVIDGDELIYILSCYLKEKKELKHNRVALTIMSNVGLIQSLARKGIEVIETPVGDKYIAEALQTYDLSLGGEASGHIILSHRASTGDGILVAIELIKILEESKKSIEEWLKECTLYPGSLENIVVRDKKKVMGAPLQKQIDMMKEELKQDCKIIVRPSGTEDYIRISVMAKTKELVEHYKERLIRYIRLLDA